MGDETQIPQLDRDLEQVGVGQVRAESGKLALVGKKQLPCGLTVLHVLEHPVGRLPRTTAGGCPRDGKVGVPVTAGECSP